MCYIKSIAKMSMQRFFFFQVNVALNKPAYQHHPAYPGFDQYDASNAVDGHRSDLRWDGGQCVVSAGSGTATWWVNLTSIYSIHHITIYYRTEASIWGMINFFVDVFCGRHILINIYNLNSIFFFMCNKVWKWVTFFITQVKCLRFKSFQKQTKTDINPS